MGDFSYKAVNANGKFIEGRVEAADTAAAAFNIRSMGFTPVLIDESTRSRRLPSFQIRLFRRVTRKDILFFTEELATLVGAGLPLDRSLSITRELTHKPALTAVIDDVLQQIKGGKSLAEAMASHPKHFSHLHVSMIRAGEAGGVLDTILVRLAEFERSAEELRSYLISSLVYPALLTLVGLGSFGILFYFVIPRFASIFEDIGAQIPATTLMLLTMSQFTQEYWWLLLSALLLFLLGAKAWLNTSKGRRMWNILQFRLPVLGPTFLKVEIARFARTLGTLIGSAVPLIAGVRIVQNIANNQILAEAISKIADGAKRGEGVAKPMREAGLFPGLVVHLVAVGEETGRLDTMLLQLADVYEKDVKTSVKSLTALFEPLIILIMGVLIGTVVLSMLMAIFSINDIAF